MEKEEELGLSNFFTATAIFDTNWDNIYADRSFSSLTCENPVGKNVEQLLKDFNREAVELSIKKNKVHTDPFFKLTQNTVHYRFLQ